MECAMCSAFPLGPARSCDTSVAPILTPNGLTSCRGPFEALFLSPGGVMGPLGELLATDHQQTLEFFILGLRDVSEPTVDREELFYNASVLAHYAQVSTQSGVEWPAPANLSEVFDHFVSDTLPRDSLTMEVAGTQCLLLAGVVGGSIQSRASTPLFKRRGS